MPRISCNYRSKFEKDVAKFLKSLKIKFKYESKRIPYEFIAQRTYLVDFILPNGIIVETKGRFTASDRKKHLLLKEQHPEIDIRLLFQRSANTLYKGSQTTYGMWCDKYNIKWCDWKDTETLKRWIDE